MADMTNAPARDKTEVARAEATRGGVFFSPRVDICETDRELTLFAELPGVKPEDVSLRYENGELVLHGKVQPRQGPRSFLLQEYEQGDFYRAFAIHESIDSARIEAESKNGVLIVHLPKVEAARPRQINVKA
jgi:HSP20 family molecular chaperone IbpA